MLSSHCSPMQMLLMEVIVSCLSKYLLPLDVLGHVQHHIPSIHLFFTRISQMTRKKEKKKNRKTQTIGQ